MQTAHQRGSDKYQTEYGGYDPRKQLGYKRRIEGSKNDRNQGSEGKADKVEVTTAEFYYQTYKADDKPQKPKIRVKVG
jgi:hypothetical protein